MWGEWGPWVTCTGDGCGYGKRTRRRRPLPDTRSSPCSVVDVVSVRCLPLETSTEPFRVVDFSSLQTPDPPPGTKSVKDVVDLRTIPIVDELLGFNAL